MNYTKVNIKKEVLEVAKKIAAEQHRSVSNLIENIILGLPDLLASRESAAIEWVLEEIEEAAKNSVEPGFVSPSEAGHLYAIQAYAMQRQINEIRTSLIKK